MKTIQVANNESVAEVTVEDSPMLHKKPLPKEEFGGESETATNIKINICDTHNKDRWLEHRGYIDNRDGTISCKWCPWGTHLGGRYRVYNERIIDLKTFTG